MVCLYHENSEKNGRFAPKRYGGDSVQIKESAEMYLETIYTLNMRGGGVRAVDVATEMSFSKPSVSVAMKNLRQGGYVDITPEGFLVLTDKGRAIAEMIYERHTVLSQILMALGVEEKTAAEDACRMEHVISPESFAAVKAFYETHLKNKKTPSL